MTGNRDLRGFLRMLEERGELRRVAPKVDPDMEIAAVTDRVCKRAGGGPALLFEKVTGHSFPVATNLFGSHWRISRALGGDRLDEIAGRLAKSLEDGDPLLSLQNLVQSRRQRDCPPCREVIETVPDLTHLPALRNWPGDAGRFLTLPLVFTRDPETGQGNCGMYRVQLFDGRTATLHWGRTSGGAMHAAAWRARGVRMPVAIVLGGPPALTWAAAAPLPPGVDELSFAGWLLGEAIETTFCCAGQLEVPATAEFVLEGYVEPGEYRLEGPFGNHTGFYAPPSPAAVFHVERMTRRHDAILPCTVVGRPPTENLWLARATERLFLPLLQKELPGVLDLRFLAEGAFHGCALVALSPEAAGRGSDIIERLWETGLLGASRLLVAVDADVDLDDGSLILWRSINQVDPSRDLIIRKGRLGIDATEKEGRTRVMADREILRRVEKRWREYGID